MPIELPHRADALQRPRFRCMIPTNSSAMLSGISQFNPTVTPNRHSFTRDYVKTLIAQDPIFLSSFLHDEERRSFFNDYFCKAVLKGNANQVYAIQSEPLCRIDLDKTIINTGFTALQVAAVNGFSDLLRVLFHFGASTNFLDANGNTALRLALARSDSNDVRGSELSDVAMLIGYTQIRTLKTNGLDTFLPADLEKLKDERYKHFVDELKSKYPEFESFQI